MIVENCSGIFTEMGNIVRIVFFIIYDSHYFSFRWMLLQFLLCFKKILISHTLHFFFRFLKSFHRRMLSNRIIDHVDFRFKFPFYFFSELFLENSDHSPPFFFINFFIFLIFFILKDSGIEDRFGRIYFRQNQYTFFELWNS